MNTAKKSDSTKSKEASIKILKIEGNYLVIGSSNGSIRFYDFQYRIIAWFEEIDVGSITNISFANQPIYEDSVKKEEDNDTVFQCPDFIVVDEDAKITLLESKLFEEIDK